MDVIYSVTTALLEYYPLTLTVLLEYIGWFLKPLYYCSVGAAALSL